MSRAVLLLVAILSGGVALIYAGITNTRDVAKPVSYYAADERTLDVVAVTGANRGCRLGEVAETDTEVALVVLCAEVWISLGGPAYLRSHVYEARLQSDLADRDVVDGRGQPARRCATPRCEGDPLP